MHNFLQLSFVTANALVLIALLLFFQLLQVFPRKVPENIEAKTDFKLPASPPYIPTDIPTPTEILATPTPTKTANVAVNNLYCVTAHLDDRDWAGEVDRQVTLIKTLGVSWVRFDIAQVVAESERDYGYYKRIVDSLNKKGIGVILIIDQWGQTGQPWKAAFTSPDLYGQFAGRVAANFKGKKVIYQLGNEPDYRDMDIPTYTKFMIAAYDSIKAADSNSQVITAGVGTSHALEWINGIYANGGKGKFDGFSIHRYVYPSPPEAKQFNIINQLKNIMAAQGENKRVYITELGWMTAGEEGVSEENQANYIAEAYRLLGRDHKNSIGAACLYRFADKAVGEDDAHFGIVVQNASEPDGYRKKPGFYSFQKIINSNK